MAHFKPTGYTSVSPYLVVEGAQRLIDLLTAVFEAEALRRYEAAEGKIVHAELRIDDSVLMLADASPQFGPIQQLTHIYVADVDATFDKAIALGCEELDRPKTRPDDPDKRGAFKDFAGNIWSVATQVSDAN